MTDHPSDISPEAWYLALPFVVEHFGGSGPTTVGFRRTHLIIARAVMTAMAEEREACARLIEQTDLWFSFEPTVPSVGVVAMAPHATPIIAAAIRKRGETSNG